MLVPEGGLSASAEDGQALMAEELSEVVVDLPSGPSWEVLPDFERFSQVDDVFNRAFWDPEIATAVSYTHLTLPTT